MKDTYKTITKPSKETLFKDRNSKFFGFAFPVSTEEDVKQQITLLKKKHHAARHWCYAYQLGADTLKYRVNDDGEPANSAGQPIYGQIQSFDVTNILIVVVRYFGGVKLGVGGLINAYRTAAKLSLEESTIVEKTIDSQFKLVFDYKNMNKVMRIVKEKNVNIISQQLEINCQLIISVRKSESEMIKNLFEAIFEVKITNLLT
ncbi:IMPACT family protein [Spongiivirga citrea]|uniref:YigZ family protein n=1 Tax=Spongiivirga citrea TaxID=1481457 RepID=A0A6M0CJM8_9FLAO|nr:YigZ family protein [Spongiivirga citrea]NER15657.1 YigZ family protein [Spongiivirga citrea]